MNPGNDPTVIRQTIEAIKDAHHAGQLDLFDKFDTSMLVSGAIRVGNLWVRCYFIYHDLSEAIGEGEINRLLRLREKRS